MTKPAEPRAFSESSPRQEGHLSGWNEARGFGFLKAVDGGPDAFAHIRAFAKEERHIEEGHLYSYQTETDEAGRLRAADIRPIRPVRPEPVQPSLLHKLLSRSPRILVIPAFLFIAIAVAITTTVSPGWFIVYGVASIACFIGYGLDKRAATHKQWRVSETILLMVGLVGGWPGAILAQEFFRHKTKKPAFRTLFWMSVAINMAAFVQIAAFTGA
ncbi:cold shock DNA-binding membrane protein [Hyphomonas neptunium ATCC 15444]|uniref:Cold shock DNA-binding membrane protein n=2 Tax=Hyphomonas TaxID=85 RepID=Q0C0X9_HYPNA|nr:MULTISPECIES: DUF1294 domain-containing protein [Hyphomonas]ABI76903.1 cold shock DNA-binding membrane protein [Hyphomonas neptunium ATCC 15444]KCZ94971.1 cold shock DNA-binding membrane protein [Hyphomonas hirschiana VP5]